MDVWDLLSWGLWVSGVISLSSFLIGVASLALGDVGRGKTLIGGSLLGMLVFFFGWGLVTALYPVPPPIPYSWVLYVLSGIALFMAVACLSLGRLEEGSQYLVGALLTVGLGFFAASVASGVELGPAGSLSVSLYPSSTYLQSGETLTLGVCVSGTAGPLVDVSIDWGDGTTEQHVITPDTIHSYNHTYVTSNTSTTFPLSVRATDPNGLEGYNTASIAVVNLGATCSIPWPFDFLCGLVSAVKVVIPGLDLGKFTSAPPFPTSPDNELYQLYQWVLEISASILSLFLAFRIVWGFVWGGSGKELIESLKEAVVVLALSFLAPHAYNATIHVLNHVSLTLISGLDVGPVLALVFTYPLIGLILGYFVPTLAIVGAFVIIVLITTSAVVYVRYWLILTLVTASPLIAVSWIHPALRKTATHLLTLLAGLVLAGPIAAVFIRIIYVMTPAKEITFSLVFPILVGIIPNVLGVLGAGASASASHALTSLAWVLSVRLARRLDQTTASGRVTQPTHNAPQAVHRHEVPDNQALRTRVPRPKLTTLAEGEDTR
jgi:hypothetical protein